MEEEIVSVCPYCGCGCKLRFVVEDNVLVKVLPCKDDEISRGKPCIKGLTLHEVTREGRITQPLVRKSKNSKLKPVTWEKALEFIYKKTKNLSPEEVIFVPSGKVTNEDNYVMQKFARIVFFTNNVDSCCTRLCHKATVEGMRNVLGIGAAPWRLDDIFDRDCLLIIGSNPASNYPAFFQRVMEMKKKGLKILSVQAIVSITSQRADVAVTIYPGTETALLNGMMNYLISTKSYDKTAERIEGFGILKRIVEKYEPEVVCKLCRLRKREFLRIAESIAESEAFAATHGMGLTQHVNAIENVHSLLNLVLLKGGKLLSWRGQVNVQGAGDMGGSPEALPLGAMVNVEKLKKLWGRKVPLTKGRNILEAFLISPVKAAFLSSFNPAQSLPDLTRVHKNLRKIFLIQMESYFNLTSKFADVILPTPILLERRGTITNCERRVRLVNPVLRPIGRPEWKIFKALSNLFGKGRYFGYSCELEIFREIVEIIPDYRDVDPEFVYRGNDGWADKEIKFKRFVPEEFEGVEEMVSKEYPFVFTTFRSPYQFLTGEMTEKSERLRKLSFDGCYLNERDAKVLRVMDGDVVEIISPVSKIRARVKTDKRIPKGVVGMHLFSKALPNKLFPLQFDEETFTPNYKIVGVKIKKVRRAKPLSKAGAKA